MAPFMGPAGGGVFLAMKADGHELGGDLLEMLRETDRRAEESLAG